jgi:hypothetical protein
MPDDVCIGLAYRKWQAQCHVAACCLGNYTSWMLARIHGTPSVLPTPVQLNEMRACYQRWLEYTVLHAPWMDELRTIKLPTTEIDEATGLLKVVRVTESVQFHVFFGLSRLWYCMQYEALMTQQRSLLTGKSTADEAADIVYCAAHIKERALIEHGVWPTELRATPFLSYTQSQVKATIMSITETFADLPACSELVRIIELLFTANSVFLCVAGSRALLDAEYGYTDIGNDERQISRDYLCWSSVYFGQLLRRIYYLRLIGPNKFADRPPPAAVAQFKDWVKRAVIKMPDDTFEDLHSKTVDECYTYPGDDLYLHYQWPDRTPARGEILAELRPNRSAQYQSESQLSKQSVMAEDTHVTRMFIVGVLDQVCSSTPRREARG